MAKGEMSPRILNRIVHRVVQVADPERINLFGSAARGEMGPESDLDLLVIKAWAHRRQLAQAIYRALVARYRNVEYLILSEALREGRVVYERPA